MRRFTVVAFLMIACAVAGCAADQLPPPVCARDDVLQRVQERLRRAGEPDVLEVASVGQAPAGRDSVVNCAIRLHRIVYDTPHTGPQPREVVRDYHYALQLRTNGIFLLP